MTARSWVRRLFARSPRTTRIRKRSRTQTRLGLNELESRTLLSATHFGVVPSAPAVLPYTAFGVTVTAEDAAGNTATDYLGTAHFSSSDSRASLPADYTFTAADHGVHTFSGVIFRTTGSQTLTASNGVLGAVTEFAIPTAGSNSQGITAGPDGNLWFTESGGNKVGKITPAGAVTEFPIPTPNGEPQGITAGPDGNLWFVEWNGTKVGKITPAGAVTEFSLPVAGSAPLAITAGPDGNLWFVEEFNSKVGKITPAGAVTEYPIPTANSFPIGITAGPDGNLWFTETGGNKVGKITPAGAVTEYAIPTANSQPQGITAGPDGNLWFVENNGNQVGRITPAGALTEYPIATANSQPQGITAGPDGNLWFTESNGNQVGRITPGGTVTEFPVTTGGSQPDGITAGPDGNLWFVENNGNQVGRITSAALSGSAAVAVPGPATHFVVTMPANPAVAGIAFSVTVTAQDSHGLTAIGFGGPVHLSSSDVKASLPADYTFTAADHGVHTFSGVTFYSAGNPTLTAASGTPIGTVTEFPLANPHSGPAQITAGPDGNLWFTENAGNAVGKITPAGVINEITINTPGEGPEGITAGPDGNVWFTLANGNGLARIDPANLGITENLVPTANSQPWGITAGPDGNIWFTEFDGNKVAKVTAAGVFTEYPILTANSGPQGITVGPDGNLWFVEKNTSNVCMITPGGAGTEFQFPTANSQPYGITADGGYLYVTESNANQVDAISPGGLGGGTLHVANSQPEGIAADPDGNLWFTEFGANKVATFTVTGVLTEYAIPTASSGPQGITAGPDGNIWFTEANGNKVGRITLVVPAAGSAPVSVVAAAADHYTVATSAANPDLAGTPLSVTVTAFDPYGNTATGFRGAVHFSSSDPTATLPADYTFTAADNGVHTFGGVVFRQAGGQTLTLTATGGAISAVTEFAIPTAYSAPVGITAGPDGNLWFTEDGGNKVGRLTPAGVITEFPIPTPGSGPVGITTGPDGNLWFVENVGNKVAKITPAGVITEYAIPTPNSGPVSILAGHDGNLWFTELSGNKVGRITPAGAVTEFPIPTANSQPWGITYISALGLDSLAFTEYNGNKIGSITTAGAITEFPIPTSGSAPRGITAGPDRLYWFTEFGANKLAHGPLVGLTESPIPTSGSGPDGITAGPDGNVWFTELNGNQIGRSTPAGVVTEFALPTGGSGPAAITVGPDRNLWFTEGNGNKVGRIISGVPLGSATVTVVAAAADHFAVATSAANPDLAGTPFSVTVTAQDPFGNTVAGFDGPVHFSSSDPTATLPADYTFTAADNGVHTFGGVTLGRAGGQSLTVASAVTEFAIPTAGSSPYGITAGPDGNLWFVENDGNKVGNITPGGAVTEYAIPNLGSLPFGITAGPDGDLWFTEFKNNKVAKIFPSGGVFEFPLPNGNSAPGGPAGITAGPDGNLWFVEFFGNKVGRITPAGAVTEFRLPWSNSGPTGITAGPDGNLWFTESNGNKVGEITRAGAVAEFPLPTANSQPEGITAGPDGNLWFTESNANKVGRITPAGAVTEFPIPTGGSQPYGITAGADGNLWFTELNGNQVGRITPAGAVTEFPIPTANSQPEGITEGPDHNLWFTEANGNKVGRIISGMPLGSASITVSSAPPISLSPSTLPNVTDGTPYSQAILATQAGYQTSWGPITFAFTGTLPTGLNLSTDGVLSGTPTAPGTFTFTVTASDLGRFGVGSQQYSVTINPPPAPVVDTLADNFDYDYSAGHLSLREALYIAQLPGVTTPVTFAPGLHGAIALNGGQLAVTKGVTIQGPGTDVITVDAGGRSSVFHIAGADPAHPITTNIGGLTVTNANNGPGISNTNDTLSLNDVAVTGNSADGIDNDQAVLSVVNSTISSNLGSGIVDAGGTVNLAGSTVANNDNTGGDGGGISVFSFSASPATVTAVNSTIAGNTAYLGGGIYASEQTFGFVGAVPVHVTLTNVTVAGNAATYGAGIYNSLASTLTIDNTILGGNTGGPDLTNDETYRNIPGGAAVTVARGGNLVESVQTVKNGGSVPVGSEFDASPPVISADPMLGPLQNNGGPTPTMALLPGSPAIDKGDSTIAGLPATDQRGYARTVGNAVDIGAYEYGAVAVDLSVSGASSSSVAPGGQATFTLTVTNNSSTAQNNVILADDLPANTTLVSWTAPSGWSSSAPAVGTSGTVKAWIASLAANTSATFTLVVQVNSNAAPGTVISNTASVGPLTGDPNPNNNSVAFTVSVTAPATVLAVQVNDGTAQRSMVMSTSVFFSTIVGLPADPGAAFRLTRVSDGAAVSFTATAGLFFGVTAVKLSNFTGPATQNGSLADGRYTLTVLASQVTAYGTTLDGNGDGTAGDNYVSPAETYGGNGPHLYRLFGDVNGDGVVDATDVGMLKSTFNRNNTDPLYLWYLDANGDGVVDATDIGQFKSRFNVNVFG
jgi:uncharacterized repeat protein (TIGR01451 family)